MTKLNQEKREYWHVRIKPSVQKSVKRAAVELECYPSDIVEEAIQEWLERNTDDDGNVMGLHPSLNR